MPFGIIFAYFSEYIRLVPERSINLVYGTKATRRILGRQIRKEQIEWERAISEVRSKVRWVI
jgi:hypothetical protein